MSISCIAIYGNANASNSDLLSFGEEDLPVVLSGSRLQQSLVQSPATITILDRELIEQSGARSLVDLLYLVPGFQIGKPTNGDPVATYHGQATRYNPRLQLIVDGRPTYVPLYGGIPWSELPVSITDVERVEVTRAPNAATYGPNSFYAVISVTTRSPASGEKIFVNTEVGGNHYYSTTLTHNYSEGNFDARVTMQFEGDEGFENIRDTEQARLFSVSSNYQIDNTDSLAVSAGVLNGGHIEVDRISQDLFMEPFEKTINAYAQVVWERENPGDSSTRVQFYYNYFDVADNHTFTFDAADVFETPDLQGTDLDIFLFRDTRSTRAELEFQNNIRQSGSHRLSFGGAIREDTVRGEWLFADKRLRKINTIRAFAHSEYKFSPALILNTGILAEHNSLSGNTLSPRTSLTYRFKQSNLARISYSRGVRSPRLFASEGQIEVDAQLGNEPPITDIIIVNQEKPLDPELADVFDFVIAHYNPPTKTNLNAKLSYQLVKNYTKTETIRDYEEDLLDQQARYYTNADGSFSIKTLELEADIRPTAKSRFRIAYSRAFNLRLPPEESLSPPKNTFGLYAGYQFSKTLSGSIEYYYTSRNKWNDARRNDVSKLDRLDLRLEKKFRLGKYFAKAILQSELELSENISYTRRNEIDDLYFAKLEFELP